MRLPISDLIMVVASMLGVLLLLAAVLSYFLGRFGLGRFEFNPVEYARAAVATVLIIGYFSWDKAVRPPLYLPLILVGVWGLRSGFFRRETKPVADADFGSLKHDGGMWVGRYDTGGPERTEVLLGGHRARPSGRERDRFRAFRAAYPALEGRIAAVVDPLGTAPAGDWWLQYVEPVMEDDEDVIGLTYASRSTEAIRSIRIDGKLTDPTIRDVTKPTLSSESDTSNPGG